MERLFERFGVAFWSGLRADELTRLARRSDELGFDSYWLAEYYHYRSMGPIAAAVAAATSTIKIGMGILPTHTRHPALTAMEAATLDEMSGGRLIMGLGAARTAAIRHGEQAGALTVMRETLGIVRRLLDGEAVTSHGKVWDLEGTQLAFPSRQGMPIYVGTYPYSEKMLRLSGEIADGVVLVWCTPESVRRACAAISDGARRAGRDPSAVDVAAYLVISVDEDAAKARAACRPLVASYTPRQHRWLETGMVTEEDIEPVLEAFARGGLEAAIPTVSDAYVEKVAIAGDPAYCRDRLREYVGTGLRLPIAYQVIGPDPMHSLGLIRRELA